MRMWKDSGLEDLRKQGFTTSYNTLNTICQLLPPFLRELKVCTQVQQCTLFWALHHSPQVLEIVRSKILGKAKLAVFWGFQHEVGLNIGILESGTWITPFQIQRTQYSLNFCSIRYRSNRSGYICPYTFRNTFYPLSALGRCLLLHFPPL